MKNFFGYLCIVATAVGMAACALDWYSFAFWMFTITIASGIACLKVPAKDPVSTLMEIY